jgi:hypothetical protein
MEVAPGTPDIEPGDIVTWRTPFPDEKDERWKVMEVSQGQADLQLISVGGRDWAYPIKPRKRADVSELVKAPGAAEEPTTLKAWIRSRFLLGSR